MQMREVEEKGKEDKKEKRGKGRERKKFDGWNRK